MLFLKTFFFFFFRSQVRLAVRMLVYGHKYYVFFLDSFLVMFLKDKKKMYFYMLCLFRSHEELDASFFLFYLNELRVLNRQMARAAHLSFVFLAGILIAVVTHIKWR